MNSIEIDRELLRKILMVGAIIGSTIGSLFAVKKVREFFTKESKVQVVKGKDAKPQKKGPKSAVKFTFSDDDDDEDEE